MDVRRKKDKIWPHGYNLFRNARFQKPASFKSTRYSGNANFSHARFSRNADFDSATFNGIADFAYARYNGSADFDRATFSESAFFWGTTFRESASFGGTTFSGKADFHTVKFSGNASFYDVTYNGFTDFQFATFSSDARFRNATFSGNTVFSYASFSGNAYLDRVSFARIGDLRNCAIKKCMRWVWPGDGKKRDREGNKIERGVLRFTNLQFDDGAVLDLRRNSLQDDCKLEIYECDMSRILLEGTDCTQVGFYNNKWLKTDDKIVSLFRLKLGRDCVGDEYQIGSQWVMYDFESGYNKKYEPKPALIRRTYQQLARRFREDLDHPRANEFDRGSFEMRRREAKEEMWEKGDARRFWHGLSTRVGLFFYKNVSHYSGSIWLPIGWLVVGTILIGWLYTLFLPGYSIVWPSEANCKVINDVYINTIQVLNLGKPEDSNLLTGSIGIELLKLFQRAFSVTMIAMFIFAIRRRFKH